MPASSASALRPAGGDAGELGGQTLAERWPGVAADARRPLLLDVLRGHLSRILGTPAAQIDVERPLADLGLDSLMAVELAQALEVEVGRPVSVMQMIQVKSFVVSNCTFCMCGMRNTPCGSWLSV